ncbi:AAA family ATPase [Cupriavidus necator]|uniref:LuxR family transcriptional regulator n=1 Tax=Cupriavidus necator TaxID=106590 RepID=A0A367P9S7_CUPNE|nr:LuxR C-terminal-related transcriptional regulator [Cupriavidus necator]QQX85750.1 AAA family ATPase [Cupriavidus necator]RCJ04600.1 LuxR family transcriptional regulator [Cupriavidus necator]
MSPAGAAPAESARQSATPAFAVTPTKLVPPRGARPLMPRDTLLARLAEARRQRCIVIQGPAGCAKTSTLAAWRQALLTLDFDVAWLSLAPEDNSVAAFFNGLVASLASVDPAIVRDAWVLMGRDGHQSAVEHWVITLVRAIGARRRELVLMLDDVHHLDNPGVVLALRWLLDYAPPQLHVVLASRTAPPLSLARLRTQGLLSSFALADLRFSAQESARFLQEQLGHVDARDAGRLHELTDGWAAGLQLFAIDLKGKRGGSYNPVQVRDAQTFASYFEREVLVRLTPDDLGLLTRMALCHRFCGALCATLLGRPESAAEITARLAHLARDDLFIAQIGSDSHGDAWYRLHPLLREVLLGRLGGLPQDTQAAMHAAAWQWFNAHGEVDEAVRHAVLAGDSAAAADMVHGRAHGLLARGELSQLAALVRQLPAEQIRARFGLLLVQAHLQMYAGDSDGLQDSLQRMQAQAGRLGPREHYALAILQGSIALLRDDSDVVANLLPTLQRVPAGADDFTLTGRGNILSWMHIYRGEYDQARRVIEDGAPCDGAPRGTLLGRCMGGMTHAVEGQVLVAERVLHDVLADAEQRGAACAGVACMAAALLGETLYELNDVEAAASLLDARIDVLVRISIPDTVLRALLALSCSRWHAGDHAGALACLDRLERYGQRHRVDRLVAGALSLRSRRLLEDGHVDAADDALLRLEALAARHAGAVRSTAWEVRVHADLARIGMCLHHNDFDGALARLEPLAALSEAGGRWSRVATLRVLMAQAHLGRRDPAAARRQLVDALRIGHRHGLVRSLLDASPQVPAMLAALAGDDSLDPVLAFYAQRLADAAGPGASASPAPSPAPAAQLARLATLSEREQEVLGLLAQAMPNKKIARILNVSLDTVKWHLRNVYAKLEVTGRDQAVARLRDASALPTP